MFRIISPIVQIVGCTLLAVMSLCLPTTAQIITTVAGDGTFTLSGDGGPATLAGISIPGHLAVDTAGNLYLCNSTVVRKVDNAGIITTVAGGGTATADGVPAITAYIGSVSGISFDAAGDMHFAGACKVRKVNAAGIISTVAGTGTCLPATGDGGPAIAAQLVAPVHTAFDPMGNMYITSRYHMRMVDAAGIIHTVAGTNVDGFSGDGGPATAAQVGFLGHVVPDGHGNVYFVDGSNHRIRKIDAAGIITTIAGNGISAFSGDGGPATAASLAQPSSLVIDPWGNLYFDDWAIRVRRIDPSGIITTIAGTGVMGYSGDGGPATAATFSGIDGLAINSAGDIYVGETGNHRIRKITSWNGRPWFTPGAVVSFTACGEYNPTDTLLRVIDTNATQPITWSILSPPAHGSAVAAYSTTATGGVLTPTGTGYTPLGGYTGPDTFRVRVFDGGAYDTITVAVDVQVAPTAVPISGTDTLCVGDVVPLAVASPGGVWSSSASSAGVSATGVVTGAGVGTAVISYTVSNYCGTATATHTVAVLPAGACATGLGGVAGREVVGIYPNPNDGSFTLQLPPNTPAHITITDVTGREVQSFTASGTVPVSMVQVTGIYLVAIATEQGRYYTRVVVR